MRDRAHKALSGGGVVHSDHRGTCSCYQVVTARVEGHAVDRGGICDSLEGFLGRRFAIVEQFDREVIGARSQNSLFRVKLEASDLLQMVVQSPYNRVTSLVLKNLVLTKLRKFQQLVGG